MNILKVKDRVYQLLHYKPHLRDDDNALLASVWWLEAGLKPGKMINAHEFLRLLADGKLTSAESIRRTRQKLQEEYPLLRGQKYHQRQQSQNKVKKELGYN